MIALLDRSFGFSIRPHDTNVLVAIVFGLFVSSVLWTGLNPVDAAAPLCELVGLILKWSYRILLVPALLLQSYTLRRGLPMLAVVVLFGLIGVTSGDPTCLIVFLILIACRNVDPMMLVRVFFSVNLAFLAIVVLLHFCSLTIPVYIQRGEDIYARTSLGLSHPNALGSLFLSLGLAWIVLGYRAFKLRDLLPVVVLLVMNDLICDSRTTSLVLIFAMLSYLLVRFGGRHFQINILPAVFLCALVATLAFFVLVLTYDSNVGWMKALDSLFSSRLYNCNLFIYKYKPLLLGRDISNLPTAYTYEWSGEEISFLVDNSVVKSLIAYGIPATVLMIAGIIIGLFSARRMVEREALAFGLCMMVFAGVMESTLFSLDSNPYLIVIATSMLIDNIPYRPKHAKQNEMTMREGCVRDGN